ncbi:MAG: type 4a pilus biogenesis protein PilO [Betaproteobacteria bacterium]
MTVPSRRMLEYIVVLALGLGIAGYVFYARMFLPMSRTAAELSQRLDEVSLRIGSVAEKSETLRTLRDDYEKALKSFQAIDSTVTKEESIPYFLRDVERASWASGATLQSLSLEPPSASSPYVEVPVTIGVRGSYRQVKMFLTEILSAGRAMSVKAVRLAASGGTADPGTAEALEATFSVVLYALPKGGGGK